MGRHDWCGGVWGNITGEGECGGGHGWCGEGMTGEVSVGETCLVRGVWGRHGW